MFSDSRWWYTYVVSVFPDGDTVTKAPALHMLSQCSAQPGQIGQPATISSSTKDRGSRDFSKTQGDSCWQLPCIWHTTAREFLIESEVTDRFAVVCPQPLCNCIHQTLHPVRLAFIHISFCVLWYLMDTALVVQTQIDGCIFGCGVGRVWTCRGTDQKPFELLCCVLWVGDATMTPTLSSVVSASNLLYSITKPDPTKSA